MQDVFAPVPKEVDKLVPPDTTAGKVMHFLLRRYPIWPLIDFLSKKKVPVHRTSCWYALGGLAILFLVLQFISGILLMVYYQPSAPWASVQRIVNEVPFGAFIRSIHHWSANLFILTLFLHLFSTLFMKAYRAPRELTWLSGMLLLALGLFFGFSGYLLPWDDLSFFATRVGLGEAEKLPILGPWMAGLIKGGADVSLATIGRFYTLHVVVLPLALLGVLALHLIAIQIQGMSEPDSFRALPAEKKKYELFFPDFLLKELPLWVFGCGLVLTLAAMFPRVLGTEADPTGATPPGIAPEWYFLSQYQWLKLFPGSMELMGLLIYGIIPLFLISLPFIDREVPSGRIGSLVNKLGLLALAGLIGMTIWGWLS
jgi:cytochrome b6